MGTAGEVLEETTSLSDAVRRLWADHVIWTRQYIVAALAGSPDAEAAAGRLLRNQEEIGNAIVPLYGEAAGAELTHPLKEHILIPVASISAGPPGAGGGGGGLRQNRGAPATAIAPLKGAAGGGERPGPEKDHTLTAAAPGAAANRGDRRASPRHDRRWDANADDIAAFLAGAN